MPIMHSHSIFAFLDNHRKLHQKSANIFWSVREIMRVQLAGSKKGNITNFENLKGIYIHPSQFNFSSLCPFKRAKCDIYIYNVRSGVTPEAVRSGVFPPPKTTPVNNNS